MRHDPNQEGRLKRKPVLIANVGDLHCGGTTALAPERIQLDDGGEYRASKAQRWIWQCWEAYWARVQEAKAEANADLYIVDWLETQQFQYDVITDHLLHAEGAELLRPDRTILTGTHPEYYTHDMLLSLEAYLNAGGRLV